MAFSPDSICWRSNLWSPVAELCRVTWRAGGCSSTPAPPACTACTTSREAPPAAVCSRVLFTEASWLASDCSPHCYFWCCVSRRASGARRPVLRPALLHRPALEEVSATRHPLKTMNPTTSCCGPRHGRGTLLCSRRCCTVLLPWGAATCCSPPS